MCKLIVVNDKLLKIEINVHGTRATEASRHRVTSKLLEKGPSLHGGGACQ
jgi:hypothetical protein